MTAQSSAVVTFNFVTQAVRIVIIDGDPWFVAVDVCAALSHSDTSMAIRRLDDDEKGTSIVCTPGGNQELSIINESGLYALILTSRKPEAKKFKKWVTSEVLPAIRKTGRYELPSAPPQPTLSAEQWQIIRNLVQRIAACCKFQERASHAVYERLRFLFGLRNASDLRPEHFEAAKAELESLNVLAEQHLDRMATLDLEFIAAVIRPPVSIRKVRALVRKQATQPPLTF